MCSVDHVEQRSNPMMSAGSWQGWKSWGTSNSSWDKQRWVNKEWRDIQSEGKDFVGIERGEGILEVKFNGHMEPIIQESKGRSSVSKESIALHSQGSKPHVSTRNMLRKVTTKTVQGWKNLCGKIR